MVKSMDIVKYYQQGYFLNYAFLIVVTEQVYNLERITFDLSAYLGTKFLTWVCHTALSWTTQEHSKSFRCGDQWSLEDTTSVWDQTLMVLFVELGQTSALLLSFQLPQTLLALCLLLIPTQPGVQVSVMECSHSPSVPLSPAPCSLLPFCPFLRTPGGLIWPSPVSCQGLSASSSLPTPVSPVSVLSPDSGWCLSSHQSLPTGGCQPRLCACTVAVCPLSSCLYRWPVSLCCPWLLPRTPPLPSAAQFP